MDTRDEQTWLILELTHQGEKAAESGLLDSLLRKQGGISPAHPIFVPCLSYEYQGRRSVLSVMEGYAFIASGIDRDSYRKFGSSPYVQRILVRGSGIRKVPETIPDSAIRDLRLKLNQMVGFELEEGMKVRVVGGPLMGIVGKVIELDGGFASVLVEMRSIHAVKDFPRFLLCPVGEHE